MRFLPDDVFVKHIKPYKMFYWSAGKKVEDFVSEPTGEGKYPLLLGCHGGYVRVGHEKCRSQPTCGNGVEREIGCIWCGTTRFFRLSARVAKYAKDSDVEINTWFTEYDMERAWCEKVNVGSP